MPGLRIIHLADAHELIATDHGIAIVRIIPALSDILRRDEIVAFKPHSLLRRENMEKF